MPDVDLLVQKGAVGDVVGRYIDSDGNIVDPALDARTVGLTLDELRAAPPAHRGHLRPRQARRRRRGRPQRALHGARHRRGHRPPPPRRLNAATRQPPQNTKARSPPCQAPHSSPRASARSPCSAANPTTRPCGATSTASPASTPSASSSAPPGSARAPSRRARRSGRSTRSSSSSTSPPSRAPTPPARCARSWPRPMTPDPADATTPRVAAVCVYGDMVPYAIDALGGAHGDPDDGLISVAAVATAFPSGRSSLEIKLADTAEAVAAGADEIDMVIDRGAFLAGRYGLVFDQIAAVKEACRRADGTSASPQGHPRDRRARHLRQRAPRLLALDPRGRRLHQDLHRQGAARRDAARHAPHARGRARLAPGHRPAHRREARGRHPRVEGRDQVPRHRRRDRRRGVAPAAPVPLRRVEPPQRRAAAAPEDRRPATTPAPTT